MKPYFLNFAVIIAAVFFFAACSADEIPSAAKKSSAADGKNIVILKTSKGKIKIKLLPEKAPVTVKNFLTYVDDGFYDNTVFHRVIPNFVIQGGGYSPDMTKKTTRPPIKNEADNGLKNRRATLSMARTSAVNSATSQFFINLKDNDYLDHSDRSFGYAVFAEVIAGMDVVDKIAGVRTGTAPMRDCPVEPVIIKTAERVKSSK